MVFALLLATNPSALSQMVGALQPGKPTGVGNTSSSRQASADLTAAGTKKGRLTGATMKLQEMMKNPSGPFHASFTKTSSDYTTQETLAGKTTSDSKHLQRPQISELELDMKIMAPRLRHRELLLAEGTTTTQGAETVNGFDTIKYSVDN